MRGDIFEHTRRAWLDANTFQNDYNFSRNDVIRGQHTLRARFDMRLQQMAAPGGGNNTGFKYTNGFTKQFYNANEALGYQSGNSIVSLVLG